MSRRLVIPAGAKPSDPSPIFDGLAPGDDPEDTAHRFRRFTWQEVADANRCDAIENLGSQWCTDNGIAGLGIATEAPPPPVVSGIPGLKAQLPAGVNLEQVVVTMRDRVIAQLDPAQADPTPAQLQTAICVLVLAIIEKAGL